MRRYHRKQLLYNTNTLYEACKELEKQMPEQTRINLFADIQEFVSSIFAFLESISCEGPEFIQLIMQMYEMLYKASQGEVGVKQLVKQARLIDICASNELKADKIEIAFFCYKASMSDSLESIYFASKKDNDCDSYFIPIPYYDRNPDRSFGKMHIEAEGFYSDQYELTDWRTYDVEARHPDVAFIMNPFDDNNLVTSVHPYFYAKHLKKCCETLCYVPYYVSPENVDYTKYGGGSVHAYGPMYADYVFLQSEKIKQAFMNAIRQFEYSHNCKGKWGNLNKKLVALGSPKFDKVATAKRGDFELPAEWLRLINDRKTILYNTTLGAALHNSELYLRKVRIILDAFGKRNDVVLWWRPHPLMNQTFASMRPNLLGEYHQIIEEYKGGGWGIYDDTMDFHRAIAWSDAYLGDVDSSVGIMYALSGKPYAEIVKSDSYEVELNVNPKLDLTEYIESINKQVNTSKNNYDIVTAGQLIYDFVKKSIL